MSGPIIRKYGFANFEKIFGEREIQHGRPDEPTGQSPEAPSGSATSAAGQSGSPPGANATEEEKQSEDSAQL